MDDEMNTAEVLRDEAKENRTREILELMRNSKTLEEAMEKPCSTSKQGSPMKNKGR